MALPSMGHTAPATENVKLKPSTYETIIKIGATETPILNKIGTSKVTNPQTHHWLTDTFEEPKKNANLELSKFVGETKNTTQKTTNATQIFISEIMVSKALIKANQYGGNEMEYQVGKKAKEHKMDMEYALFGLGRDADPKVSVFKGYIKPQEATSGEMAGIFYYVSRLMPIVSIALAVATWWIGGQGAWLSVVLGISSKSAMILNLSITLSLSFGALSGNQFFSILNSTWGLINFIGGFGANDWNLTADFTKTTVQAAQEMTSFEAGLNSLINIFSGVNKVLDVVKNITADTPKMINNNSNNQINDDKITNASAAQELAKDTLNPTIWYNFETQDLLNEESKKLDKTIFVF